MPEFPTGVVTLVFTDIEGSSALWELHRENFAPVLKAHNELMREAATSHNGTEVKTEGDAFFLAFASAGDAVNFAVDAQMALGSFKWESILTGLSELRVRMGMHTGEPILAEHPGGVVDYFGPVVNRAARVGGAGWGSQILVSEMTRALACSEVPAEIGFENLGRHRLKGVGEEILWQVSHSALPSRFPQLKTLADAKHNLPPFSTPFIGREAEVQGWSQLLRQPDIRLLTLCGFGGQGKTRLALQMAEDLVDEFADGVWWVELEEARDAEAMVSRIAHELRLHLQPQPSVRQQVFDFHRDRQMLLVLDNTEQIPDAGNIVTGLLAAAPHLKCLVTTRRALEIRAERVVTVSPLPVGDAITLFADRAHSRSHHFDLTTENRAAVEALCLALEGVPLAIELAASRLSVLSPHEMLERLDERFKLLQTRAPDLPPRQRALRGAIDWSYDLLGDSDKHLLAVLSVFAGGFTLSAAEGVSDDFDALEGVAELVRHSFLRREEHGTRARFSMIESVRAYAAEKLESQPDAAEVKQRHAKHFLQVAEKIGTLLRTCQESTALEEFWGERANMTAALNFYSERGDVNSAPRLALSLYQPLYRLGLWNEARVCLEKGLDSLKNSHQDQSKDKAALQLGLASLAHDGGNLAVAQTGAQQALELAIQASDTQGEANALNLLGLIAIDRQENALAQECFEAALMKRVQSDENGSAIALHNLALLATRNGDATLARQRYEEALIYRRAGGDVRGEAETLGNLGVLEHNEKDFVSARQLYGQSLRLRRELRDRIGIALMLHNLAEIALTENDFERAITLWTHAERTFRDIGSAFASASQQEIENLRIKLGANFASLELKAKESRWEDWV